MMQSPQYQHTGFRYPVIDSFERLGNVVRLSMQY